MNTLLPEPDYLASAASLDSRRLNNQRNEALAILGAIDGRHEGYRNHRVTRMWAPWRNSLVLYGMAVCLECDARGIADNTKMITRFASFIEPNKTFANPVWLGDPRLHDSHKASLLMKNKTYYSRFNWGVESCARLWWPPQSLIPLEENLDDLDEVDA